MLRGLGLYTSVLLEGFGERGKEHGNNQAMKWSLYQEQIPQYLRHFQAVAMQRCPFGLFVSDPSRIFAPVFICFLCFQVLFRLPRRILALLSV